MVSVVGGDPAVLGILECLTEQRGWWAASYLEHTHVHTRTRVQ